MKDKVILTDADGVLFDWAYAFHAWMKRHGYVINLEYQDSYEIHKMYEMGAKESKRLIRMFNESAWIRRLPPYRDAIKYVKKLHEEHGFIFHVISSLSNDQYAQHLRTKNLREMFGDTVFEEYIYLDTGADKHEVLAQYKDTGCMWIEDKPENAVVGLQAGLKSMLLSHNHNKDFNNPYVISVDNWQQIYQLATISR